MEFEKSVYESVVQVPHNLMDYTVILSFWGGMKKVDKKIMDKFFPFFSLSLSLWLSFSLVLGNVKYLKNGVSILNARPMFFFSLVIR